MKTLYRRLNEVGLTGGFVRKTALPSWWDDEIAENPAGYAQGLLFLSRHLGLDLQALQDVACPVRLRDFGVCKYKKSQTVSEEQLALARVMATRAAQLAAEATAVAAVSLPANAADIRQQILDGGARWVGLGELLEYCWSAGVPVLHLDHFPKTARRPDGFAARICGRSVVVLCRRAKFPAWLLFVLAHELGHTCLGHISENEILLDDNIEEFGEDEEEREANEFACEILTGKPDKRYVAADRWPNAPELAEVAKQLGRQQMVDPGHIALNYAHSMGTEFYPVAMAALKLLEPDANAVRLVRETMAAHLDWSRLPEDSSEFLLRITHDGSG